MVCDSKREYSATATVNSALCLETRPIDTFDAAAGTLQRTVEGRNMEKTQNTHKHIRIPNEEMCTPKKKHRAT